jgi:hypothetical protein
MVLNWFFKSKTINNNMQFSEVVNKRIENKIYDQIKTWKLLCQRILPFLPFPVFKR